MNIGVHVSLLSMVFSRYMSESEIAGSYGNSFLNFLRNCHIVFQLAAPTYIPTNNIGGFPFLYTLRRGFKELDSCPPAQILSFVVSEGIKKLLSL